MPRHPNEALFEGEPPMPVIPSCEHFAGTEQRIQKAFELQEQMGGVFDITMDLEDGAPTGEETEHAEMAARMQNSEANKHEMAGVRIHDYTHEHWRADVDIVVGEAAGRVAYLTVPKCTEASQGAEMIEYIRERTQQAGVDREIPIHILIETHGALHDAWELAALPNVQVLDFGLMDFVSAHHGTIPATAMRSPGQFDHQLIRRAKGNVVAAALAHGVVPAHNVTLELRDEDVIYGDARRAREEFGFMRQWSIYPGADRADHTRDGARGAGGRAGRGDHAEGVRGGLGADPARRRPARPRDLPLLLGGAPARPADERAALGRGRAPVLQRRVLSTA